MPRTARTNLPGVLYHVISRFADRRWFLRHDEEREMYLRMLGHALAESDWRCLAYALMSNHLHLAMIAGRQRMERWTRRVNSPFAQWLNRRHGRIGSVFAARANDHGVTPSETASLLAYIHNNPVRAGVVPRARDSTWTSHRAYLGLVRAPSWLHVDEGLRRAGFQDRGQFDEWVDLHPEDRSESNLDELRRQARRRGDIALGTPTADGDQTMTPLVAARYAHIRPDPREIIDRVANITNVGVPMICSRRRLPVIRSARNAVVQTGLATGLTKTELAAALGISAQAVHLISRREVTDLEQRVIEIVSDQIHLEWWGRRRSA